MFLREGVMRMEYIALIVIFSFYIVLVIHFNSRSPHGERELKLMRKSRWKNKKPFTHYSKCAIMCTVKEMGKCQQYVCSEV